MPLFRVFALSDAVDGFRQVMGECRDRLARQPPRADLKRWRAEISFGSFGYPYIVSSVIQLTCLTEQAVGADARKCLCVMALAAARYRAKTGKLPDKPEELVPAYLPAIPLDPYDGQPLKWKRDGEAVVLYSIGPDEKDDGGRKMDDSEKKGDLVFRYAPPKP